MNFNVHFKGQTFINGYAATGIIGSTFYCNGYPVSSPPPTYAYNCGGLTYYNGFIANGYQSAFGSSLFYCNGVATTVTTQVCGGNYYQNGMLYSG